MPLRSRETSSMPLAFHRPALAEADDHSGKRRQARHCISGLGGPFIGSDVVTLAAGAEISLYECHW